MAAALSSACAVLPADARDARDPRAVVDANAACTSGSKNSIECAITSPSARRRIWIKRPSALAPFSSHSSKRSVVRRRSMRADAALVTENWLGRDEAPAEEAVDASEFPSEFDLLMLERARLSDMEDSYRAEYDAQSALLEAEQSYLLQLESLLGSVSSLIQATTPSTQIDADSEIAGSASGPGSRTVAVTVRSKRKGERMQRRERALEKAEKVASALASAPPLPKPKKVFISHDSSDPIRAYLRNIGRSKLLTGSEEVALSRKIQDLIELERVKAELRREVGREPTISEWSQAVGMKQNAFEERIKDGLQSKDKMVNSNLRLVVSVAKNYQGRGMALQDLIQEGNLGLIKGAEKFDSFRGFKFSTYAHWWIRQAITRAIADQSRTIRLPIHLYEVISRINKAKKMLVQEHCRPPRDEEVAELVGLSVEKLQAIVKSARIPTSMERPIGEDENTTIGELVPDQNMESPEDVLVKESMKQDVENILQTLNQREREVMRLRFGMDDGRPRTLEEIGVVFKVTRERIRQIEAKAMRKLRQPTRNGVLREYLDVKIP